jgi:hypothetical protein
MGSIRHSVSMTTRASALESFASAFGRFPPRHPMPEWWNHFEEWFITHGANGTREDRDAFSCIPRHSLTKTRTRMPSIAGAQFGLHSGRFSGSLLWWRRLLRAQHLPVVVKHPGCRSEHPDEMNAPKANGSRVAIIFRIA